MDADIGDIEAQIEEFDRRNGPQGRFRRYARGRVAHFWRRQIMTLSGAVALFALAGPWVGLAAAGLAVLGELVDCLFLRRVPAALAHGADAARLMRRATLSAAVQAATIGACIALAWINVPGHIATGFALAYATGAALNAGLVLPFYRPAALVRLAVYAICVAGLFAADAAIFGAWSQRMSFDVIAAMILGYVVHVFLGTVSAGHDRQTAARRDLLAQSLELARANASLQDQQREARNLALVAKHAHDGVVMSDAVGRILWVNDAFTGITGYTPEEAIGHRPSDLLNGPETSDETSQGIARAVAAGRPHRAEILNYRKDGVQIWIETNLVPVLDATGRVELVIAIERDVTAAKAHEAALARATRAAEQGAKAKAQFLATMSHEIRTPMNGIIGMADLLSEADLDRESRHYVETIRRSAEALLTIINDILDFSRLDAGKLAIHAVEFSLPDCIEAALAILRPQARSKGLPIDVDLGAGLPGRVVGDDGRLRQVLINIVGNAIKFTSEGGISIDISAQAHDGGHRVTCAVRDTGIGIAPDRLAHVFDEFAQADSATTRQFGGTGLGLSISRLLAREMGGDITVTSTLGRGSCFTITLQFARSGAAVPGPHAATSGPVPPEALTGRTVLVAEDNHTNRLLVRKYLQHLPLTLLFAENGREAVEMTRAHRPDIVLMDMSMPEMDGLAATRAIRQGAPAQPRIVALTANAFASDKAACLNAGMDGFLTKPLRKSDLLQALAQPGPPPGHA